MPGAGLGLAIAGNVAQANGGTIEVRTGPDGSTFILAFAPQTQASAASLG
jgi:signal transduction histidine kinase